MIKQGARIVGEQGERSCELLMRRFRVVFYELAPALAVLARGDECVVGPAHQIVCLFRFTQVHHGLAKQLSGSFEECRLLLATWLG